MDQSEMKLKDAVYELRGYNYSPKLIAMLFMQFLGEAMDDEWEGVKDALDESVS